MLRNQGWMSHGSSNSEHCQSIHTSCVILCKTGIRRHPETNESTSGLTVTVTHTQLSKCLKCRLLSFFKKSAYAWGIKTNHWPALEGCGKVSVLISLLNIRWVRLVPWPFFTAGSFSRPWTPLNLATYAGWLNGPCWGPLALRCPNNPTLKGTSVAFLSRPRLPHRSMMCNNLLNLL